MGNGEITMNTKRACLLLGYGSSGPNHWQNRWEAADPIFVRVPMPDWKTAAYDTGCKMLDKVIAAAGKERVVLAAHSLGSLVTVFWAMRYASAAQLSKVAGALLVAVPNPEKLFFANEAHGFADIPMAPLPFPTITVASTNDPFAEIEFVQRCANAWASRFVEIGPCGHIDEQSGLGAWEAGRELLAEFD